MTRPVIFNGEKMGTVIQVNFGNKGAREYRAVPPSTLQGAHEYALLSASVELYKALDEVKAIVEAEILEDRLCRSKVGKAYTRKITRWWFNTEVAEDVSSVISGIRKILKGQLSPQTKGTKCQKK